MDAQLTVKSLTVAILLAFLQLWGGGRRIEITATNQNLGLASGYKQACGELSKLDLMLKYSIRGEEASFESVHDE